MWKHFDAQDGLTCPECDIEVAQATYPEELENAHTDMYPDPEFAHVEPAGEDEDGHPVCWCGHHIIQDWSE